jgi:hypothetical protein
MNQGSKKEELQFSHGPNLHQSMLILFPPVQRWSWMIKPTGFITFEAITIRYEKDFQTHRCAWVVLLCSVSAREHTSGRHQGAAAWQRANAVSELQPRRSHWRASA